jgi:hypothetical protein
MASDFLNFVIIYTILLSMFSIIGNLNFPVVPDFATLFDSFITMFNASMGNYNFTIFDDVTDSSLQNFGKFYTLVGVILFSILILNLIIAILSNTYNIFDPKSNGLYLSKILSSRDELSYDENYGSFLSAMSPFNMVIMPLVPVAVFSPPSPQFNNFVMTVQYTLFIQIFFAVFVFVSLILLPLAFLKSLIFKIQQIFKAQTTYE